MAAERTFSILNVYQVFCFCKIIIKITVGLGLVSETPFSPNYGWTKALLVSNLSSKFLKGKK